MKVLNVDFNPMNNEAIVIINCNEAHIKVMAKIKENELRLFLIELEQQIYVINTLFKDKQLNDKLELIGKAIIESIIQHVSSLDFNLQYNAKF